VCDLRTTHLDRFICDPPGVCTYNLTRTRKNGVVVNAGGDSGAPMFNRSGDDGSRIRGMHVGGCGCLDGVGFHHKVSTIENNLDVNTSLY